MFEVFLGSKLFMKLLHPCQLLPDWYVVPFVKSQVVLFVWSPATASSCSTWLTFQVPSHKRSYSLFSNENKDLLKDVLVPCSLQLALLKPAPTDPTDGGLISPNGLAFFASLCCCSKRRCLSLATNTSSFTCHRLAKKIKTERRVAVGGSLLPPMNGSLLPPMNGSLLPPNEVRL